MNNKKMIVYSMRDFDEKPFFEKYAAELGFELSCTDELPNLNNVCLAEGCRYVNIITTPVNYELMKRFSETGVEYIVTRTIGYDHIDVNAARKFGIRIANTPYGPDGVAEYSIMLMLMCIRKMKQINQRFAAQDYTLKALLGRELSDMTVGIIGTGRIGSRLIEMLSGFGCRIIASSPHPNEKSGKIAEYVPLEQLFREADIISLHAPATDDTRHIINSSSISAMKVGTVIINTARGSLIDTNALAEGLRSGKIGAAALDVVENESALFYYDRRGDILENKDMYLLNSFPNVIITHHMAFYTSQAVETMVSDSLRGAAFDAERKENPWRVI